MAGTDTLARTARCFGLAAIVLAAATSGATAQDKVITMRRR